MIKVVMMNSMKRITAMVDENARISDVLAENNYQYGNAKLTIDAFSVSAEDLQGTFADLGKQADDTVYINASLKCDNAASVTVVGPAIMVKSAIKLEDLLLISKYDGKKLFLYDEEKEPVFGIAVGEEGGSVGKFGITFSSTPAADGKAIATVIIPEGVTDVKEYILDKMGAAIRSLNELETNIEAAAESIRVANDAITDSIVIL